MTSNNTRRYSYTYVSLINSTLYGNVAVNTGGGIYTDYGSSTNTLSNCILYGNADTLGGNYSQSAQIYGGSNTVRYSCIQNIDSLTVEGHGNIGDDPLFVDPLGDDWIAGTLDDNLRLSAGSPCIDAGDNSLVPTELTTDLDGFVRIMPGTPKGEPIVDMGAYEYSAGCMPYFADAALKEAVEAALGITDPTCDDMLGLTSLSALSKNIANLSGLEYALNLTSLNLTSNKIADISPLAGLPLQYLYLGGNLVGSGDWQPTIATLPNLRTLYLHSNGLTTIPDFAEQTKLQNLFLYNNQIADLCPLAEHLTTLRDLRVQSNPLQPVSWFSACVPQIHANNPQLTTFMYDPNCNKTLTADVDGDCLVTLNDFALLAGEWLSCDYIYQELCP